MRPAYRWIAGGALALIFGAVSIDSSSTELLSAVSVGQAAYAQTNVKVGDELLAIQDVSLDEAVVGKGSRVSVTSLATASGQTYLDVALADGHVVKAVPMTRIQQNFRLVSP